MRAALDRDEALLGGIFAGSPFLGEALCTEPQILRLLREQGPDGALDRLRAEQNAIPLDERTRLMAGLRRARRRQALLIGLCDLDGLWPLERVTAALTTLADRAVQQALDHLLGEGMRRGEIEVVDPGCSGVFVLGMGKLGAGELNFSSDIDLIVLFDGERLRYRGSEGPMAFCVRLARSLVYLLETRNKDGYVFRTDLRLRPHLPGHPLALSSEDAELYYERHGQNWERAALIKARVVAGDIDAGEGFLKALVPFIWRKHLDYAAIRDIHSIKRQINAYRGFGTIRVLGHDLKVGRGGIREIEFFAQTQQLILGGREAGLRQPQTCAALAALAERRWVEEDASAELIAAYRVLRELEHRLQMVADRQTQALPEREPDFEKFAAFAGFAEPAALEQLVLTTLLTVERHYAALFEREPDLGAGSSLVFTGTGDDPETLKTLAGMGFKDASAISGRIRAWHHGHIRATRTTRARELLTELTPALLTSLQDQPDRDAAFRLFDEFLTGLPSGVQLFSLLRANPELLNLLADLMGAAPRLAHHLSSHVDLFDAMLTPDFFERLPDRAMLAAELRSRLGDSRDLQDTLDICRRWAHGRQFQAGLQILSGIARAEAAAQTLADIAEVVMASLLPAAERRLATQHGTVPGGAFVVLGLGKLGSHELTVGSDLDLVFVYEAPADAVSNGPRPLPAATYYARLGQRLVSNLVGQDGRGPALRDRHAAAPIGQCRASGDDRLELRPVSCRDRPALGAAGADPGARRRRRRCPGRTCRGRDLGQPRSPTRSAGTGQSDPRHARAHLQGARQQRRLEPQARPGRPGRDRVRGPAPQARPCPCLPGPAPHRHARDPGGHRAGEPASRRPGPGAGPRPCPASGPPGRAAPVDQRAVRSQSGTATPARGAGPRGRHGTRGRAAAGRFRRPRATPC